MDFSAIHTQVIELLQREGRVAYRALKLQFQLDDDHLEALKDDLIYAKRLAVDEDGRVLVWAGGAQAGNRAAAGALGTGQGRRRAGRAGQRRSGDWQIASRAGAARTRGRRAAGVADTVPVFALSPAQRLVSADRRVGAGGTALRAGRDPAAEAEQTGGLPGAVWPVASRGRAALCRPPCPAAGHRLRPPDPVHPAAEAPDP